MRRSLSSWTSDPHCATVQKYSKKDRHDQWLASIILGLHASCTARSVFVQAQKTLITLSKDVIYILTKHTGRHSGRCGSLH